MKSLYLLFGCLILQQIIVAQLPPWNLEFYVFHPDGHTDTLWVGCDENATAGYDEGLDIIDTTFNTPIAIRGFSQEVEDEFGFGTCVNLKKDIRPFGYPTEFTFYILHDEIGTSDSVFLGWDTSTINYEVEDYWIEEVSVSSYFGYLDGIDGKDYLILHRLSDSTVWLGYFPIPIFSLGETLPCFNNTGYSKYYLKIVLKAYFKDYEVYIDRSNTNVNEINIITNSSLNYLQVHSQIIRPVQAYIYNNLGKVAETITIIPGNQVLDISNLSSGVYFLHVPSGILNNTITYKFIK